MASWSVGPRGPSRWSRRPCRGRNTAVHPARPYGPPGGGLRGSPPSFLLAAPPASLPAAPPASGAVPSGASDG
eukprot:6644128-Alexandrium_andersonii.AAC.1